MSQKFASYEVYAGRGDTTTTFVELGYRYRVNDSLRDGDLVRVNSSNNYYIRSQPIKNKVSNLRVYANYRKLKSELDGFEDEVSFNSRIQYKRKFYGIPLMKLIVLVFLDRILLMSRLIQVREHLHGSIIMMMGFKI